MRDSLVLSLLFAGWASAGCSSGALYGGPPQNTVDAGPDVHFPWVSGDAGPVGEALCGPQKTRCLEGQRCSDTTCGIDTHRSACEMPPEDCDVTPQPVCGCDGAVHEAWCLASSVCYDERCASRCHSPPGYFACAGLFCKSGTQYCALERCSGTRRARQCVALPSQCRGTPTCGCIEYGGSPCETSQEGDVTLTTTDRQDLCSYP